MELKFSKIVDKKTKTASMFIYDMLGIKDEGTGRMIDGHDFAREMRYLDEYYDEIELHINSDGGLVSHGLSIISAMRDIDAKVITINDGVCASMCSMILLNGDEVRVKDFSKTMLHRASLVGEDGKPITKPSVKQKESIAIANDTLMRLLAKRGKDKEAAETIITKKDNWFDPEALLTEGLIDSIVPTGRVDELAAVEPLKLVALLRGENPTLISNNNMKGIVAFLNNKGAFIDR